MTSLLDCDDLLLQQTAASALTRVSAYEISDASGASLASVRQDPGSATGFLGRLFAHRPGMRAAELEVLDPSGARLFGIAKAHSRVSSLAVAVSLADGRPVGSASTQSHRPRSLRVQFFDAGDAPLGELQRDSAALATVRDAAGREAGSVQRQLRTRSAAEVVHGGATTYRLSYAPGAPTALRVVALAVVIAANLQQAL